MQKRSRRVQQTNVVEVGEKIEVKVREGSRDEKTEYRAQSERESP